jgi:hypothetical protein
MSPSRLERERPSEWLNWLDQAPDAYQILVAYAGGMARAAYRLATVRLRLRGSSEAPTLDELQAAAWIIAGRLGKAEALPITSLLPSDPDARTTQSMRPVSKAPAKASSSRPPLRRAS